MCNDVTFTVYHKSFKVRKPHRHICTFFLLTFFVQFVIIERTWSSARVVFIKDYLCLYIWFPLIKMNHYVTTVRFITSNTNAQLRMNEKYPQIKLSNQFNYYECKSFDFFLQIYLFSVVEKIIYIFLSTYTTLEMMSICLVLRLLLDMHVSE